MHGTRHRRYNDIGIESNPLHGDDRSIECEAGFAPPLSGSKASLELSDQSCRAAMNDSNSDTTALYRNGILVLVLVSIALIVHNIFGQNGYLASRRQQKELQTLQQQIHAAQTGK